MPLLKRLFKKEKQEHRILRQIERTGDTLQSEYHRATPECPHPERWSMFDSMTAELEVLEFLRTLVTTIKRELIVETGTFGGVSTIWLAEGLKANGRGKIISCEFCFSATAICPYGSRRCGGFCRRSTRTGSSSCTMPARI